MNSKPRIAFVTSCRSDFAKLRPYIGYFVKKHFSISLFVTSMHVNAQLGCTREEMLSYFPTGVQFCWDESFPQQQPLAALAHLLTSIENFLTQQHIQFLFVHGDRMEAFAAATAAALHQIPICQIEAGDISGNIDESFRHAITKLSHRFLVDNDVAKHRVERLGEDPKSIFLTESSSIYLLPSDRIQRQIVRNFHLEQPYAVLLYHPETGLTDSKQYRQIYSLIKALKNVPIQYLVLAPNNDPGYPEILRAYEEFPPSQIVRATSLPCEIYLTLLNRAVCLVGNSSSSIKDAPCLGVPSITLGNRQYKREAGLRLRSYKNVSTAKEAAKWVNWFLHHPRKIENKPFYLKSFEKRLNDIFTADFFRPDLQKHFHE